MGDKMGRSPRKKREKKKKGTLEEYPSTIRTSTATVIVPRVCVEPCEQGDRQRLSDMTTTNYHLLGSLSSLLSCHILDAPTFGGAVGPKRTGTRVDVRFEMMHLREVWKCFVAPPDTPPLWGDDRDVKASRNPPAMSAELQ